MSNYEKYMKAVREFKALSESTPLVTFRAAEDLLIDTWRKLTVEEQTRARIERVA